MNARVVMAVVLVLVAAGGGVLLGTLVVAPYAQAKTISGNEGSVNGVCMFSRQEVLAKSKIGQAADQRLKQLTGQIRNRLKSDRDSLAGDVKKFQESAKSMSDDKRKAQQAKLQKQGQVFQQEARQYNARLRYTKAMVIQRLDKLMDPLLNDAYKKHDCGILLDRDTVLSGNESNDLTPDVTDTLNDKAKTISFGLLALPSKTSSEHGKSGSSDDKAGKADKSGKSGAKAKKSGD